MAPLKPVGPLIFKIFQTWINSERCQGRSLPVLRPLPRKESFLKVSFFSRQAPVGARLDNQGSVVLYGPIAARSPAVMPQGAFPRGVCVLEWSWSRRHRRTDIHVKIKTPHHKRRKKTLFMVFGFYHDLSISSKTPKENIITKRRQVLTEKALEDLVNRDSGCRG